MTSQRGDGLPAAAQENGEGAVDTREPQACLPASSGARDDDESGE